MMDIIHSELEGCQTITVWLKTGYQTIEEGSLQELGWLFGSLVVSAHPIIQGY